jgi:flagellar basal body rod protein FlgG
MTHDGSQTAPAGTRATGRRANSLLLSGIVVGVALGIAVGHLVLIARGRSTDGNSAAEEEFARLVAASPRFAAADVSVPHSIPHEDLATSILEFDGSEDVGRVRLSDQSTEQEHLHYFPEAMTAPEAESFAHADRTGTGRTLMSGPLQMTAESSHASDAPPQALKPSPAAAPIDKATSDRQAMARSIIRDELPDATAQEQEIWLEVLQGLSAEDIKGILRMRKHLGPGRSLEMCPPLSLPAPLSGLPGRPAESAPPPGAVENESIAGRRLRQIIRHNLANRSTVAFKREVPILVEASADDPAGIGLHHVIRDMRQGELESTGRPLDVALSGPGFLQVRRDDEICYTRDGRLTLDEQGRLKLLGPAGDWLVEPTIVIPDDARDIVISEEGEISVVLSGESTAALGALRIIQFLDPSALKAEPEGLYQPTRASGAAQDATAGQRGATVVVQRHLERSNVFTPAAPTGASCDASVPQL